MKRTLQVMHLCLIVAIAALYAWLMLVLPAEDPWRVRISGGVAMALAIWGALVFIETLRLGDAQSWIRRCLDAYRRLLNRGWTLAASTGLLGVVAGGLVFVGAGYGAVEILSNADQDVFVFLSDPGTKPQRIALVAPRQPTTARLPIGQRWLYFATATGEQVPYGTGRIDVLPLWRSHGPQTIRVPEVPKYVGN
jgi:hypothetical protein